ncbi:MAG: caspase family protein [Bacteroidota bacterium]
MSDHPNRALEFNESLDMNSKERKNHLFVIGINKYQHANKLNNARRDAETFKKILLSRYQFDAESVHELYDEEATRRNILKTFDQLSNTLTEEDNLIIYFSGHGVLYKGLGYWVPVDCETAITDGIPNDRINNFLQFIKAHHIYLIIDACYSGSFISRDFEKTLNLMEAYPSRRVLTSGRNEVVSDGASGTHSPFFSAIKSYLEAENGPVTASELENHVIHNTPRSANQLPLASYIQGTGDQSGQMVIYPRKDEAKEWAHAKQSNNITDYKNFLERHPKSIYAEEASWEIASLSKELVDYRFYLNAYPSGKHAKQAIEKLGAIEEEKVFLSAKTRGEAALRKYILDYSPNGLFIQEAKREIETLHAHEISTTPASTAYSSHLPNKAQTADETAFRLEKWLPYALIGIFLSIIVVFVVRNLNSTSEGSTNRIDQVKVDERILKEYTETFRQIRAAFEEACLAQNMDLMEDVEDALVEVKKLMDTEEVNKLQKEVQDWKKKHNTYEEWMKIAALVYEEAVAADDPDGIKKAQAYLDRAKKIKKTDETRKFDEAITQWNKKYEEVMTGLQSQQERENERRKAAVRFEIEKNARNSHFMANRDLKAIYEILNNLEKSKYGFKTREIESLAGYYVMLGEVVQSLDYMDKYASRGASYIKKAKDVTIKYYRGVKSPQMTELQQNWLKAYFEKMGY